MLPDLAGLLFTVVVTGSATYYSPNLFEEVYANRLAWHQVQPCAECVGFVALNDPQYLGKLVYLDWPGYGISGPYLDADCEANYQPGSPRERHGRVVEVDWLTSRRFAMRGPVAGVRVLLRLPPVMLRVATPHKE
jgi:hypothetical protein